MERQRRVMRRLAREGRVAALRDGRRQRAVTFRDRRRDRLDRRKWKREIDRDA